MICLLLQTFNFMLFYVTYPYTIFTCVDLRCGQFCSFLLFLCVLASHSHDDLMAVGWLVLGLYLYRIVMGWGNMMNGWTDG